MKVKLRATVTIIQEYEADSKDYCNAEYIGDMIDMDKKNFRDDPIMFIDTMLETGGNGKIKISKIKEEK